MMFIVSSKFLGSVMQPTLSLRSVALYRLVFVTLCDGLLVLDWVGCLGTYTRSLTGTQDTIHHSFQRETPFLAGAQFAL
jgi:hypothetical protein